MQKQKMARFLLSPSEVDLREELKDDAIVSPIPEEKGADVLHYSKLGLYGAQRKTLPHDFIASISDGRMARATSLLPKSCKFYELIGEGRFRYWPDGHLILPGRKEPSRFTRRQIRGILFDIKYVKGIPVEYTEDVEDTANYLRWLADLLDKGKHLGLYTRPSVKGIWYVPTGEEIWSWILQSWPGVGPATAEAIIKYFGTIPLKWSCTLDELQRVPRLGKPKARELYNVLASSSLDYDGLRRMLGG